MMVWNSGLNLSYLLQTMNKCVTIYIIRIKVIEQEWVYYNDRKKYKNGSCGIYSNYNADRLRNKII